MNNKSRFFIFIISLIFASNFVAASSEKNIYDGITYENQKVMNDIKFNDFKDFEKKWKIVTVRYRKDTSEMRWTYANPEAMKVLDAGSIDYPDGAVLAKIGIRTLPDPQFESSAVPHGARRYQFMVRDRKKYADTGGWGYALFDVNGKTFPENPKDVAMACFACHKIVENRGQVFSQVFELAPFSKTHFLSKTTGVENKIEFQWIEVKRLSNEIQKLLPKEATKVRIITSEFLTKSIFQGTLDEIKPTLEREAFESNSPAILTQSDGKRFAIVFPISKKDCKIKRSFKSISTTLTGKLNENEYCNP